MNRFIKVKSGIESTLSYDASVYKSSMLEGNFITLRMKRKSAYNNEGSEYRVVQTPIRFSTRVKTVLSRPHKMY